MDKKNEVPPCVLNSRVVDLFETSSDIGSFKIDGQLYSNFYGDGANRAEICACNFADFKKAKLLTRRQVFNRAEPITIVKYESPRRIEVSLDDCDNSAGVKVIDNVCGFVIWACKIKIFVINN